MPKITDNAKRLRIYLCASDCVKHKMIAGLVVQKAKELNLAGASVYHGVMGYGVSSRIHAARIFSLCCDLPVVIEIVDSEEYIAKILPYLDEIIPEGLVTMDNVEAMKYRKIMPKR